MTVYRFGNDYLLQKQFNTGQNGSTNDPGFTFGKKMRFRIV